MRLFTRPFAFGTDYLRRIHKDSLYRNSLYLIASQFVLSFFGFFFWIINARLFPPEYIGIATTLISVTGFITSFSLMGLNSATIRYLPKYPDKKAFINTGYALVSIAAALLTFIFIVGVRFFSPPLAFLQSNPLFILFLICFMMISSVNAITDSIFIALRSAKFVFVVNTVAAVTKLLAPFLFIGFGMLGVYYSYAVSIFVAAFLSITFITFNYGVRFLPSINTEVTKTVRKFSFGQYVAGLIGMLNSTLAPILITNRLGPEITAYYYMPTMIVTMLLAIPRSTSSSMYAEGSHEKLNDRILFTRTLRATLSIVLPSTLVLMIIGEYILSAFGKSYSNEGIVYLRLALVSIIIAVPNYLLGTVLNIRKKVRASILMSVFSALTGITLTVIALPFGLSGLGVAAIVGQILGLAAYLVLVLKYK